MRRWFRSIGVQLFAWIFGSMVVVFLLAAYLNDRSTSEAWQKSFEEQSHRMAAVIDRALRYGMLLEDKEAVERSFSALGEEPGVELVRIYDKKGDIAFSTDPAEVGKGFPKKSDACNGCHSGYSDETDKERWSRTFRDSNGHLRLSHINVVENEDRCASADCHVSPDEKPVLGTLEVRTSLAPLATAHAQAERNIVYATILMALAGGLVAGVFIWRFVRRPMKQLTDGIQHVAEGDLPETIYVSRKSGELRELAVAFNRMTAELRDARARTEAWEHQLEEAVEKKTEELRRVHHRMLQMEKMAALGKLAATVAHELNNPLAGIMVYAKLVKRELEDDGDEDSRRHLDVIMRESSRCGDIVKNLLTFARESSAQFSRQDINEVVDRAVTTVQHLLKNKGVELDLRALEGDPCLEADGNQIQQALVALFINAVEAMPNGGELVVDVRGDDESIHIDVRDTGIGIDPDVLPSIFEPFVSTKEDKGVGLGLSVVYGIVQRHSGSVEADSTPGQGTTMKLVLPRHPSASKTHEEDRNAA